MSKRERVSGRSAFDGQNSTPSAEIAAAISTAASAYVQKRYDGNPRSLPVPLTDRSSLIRCRPSAMSWADCQR